MEIIKKITGFIRKFRFLFFLGVAFLSAFDIFAFDFGGILKNTSAFESNENNDFKLNQKNSASVWLRAPFDKSGKNYFATDFVYNFEADMQNETYKNVLDFNLFEFSLSKEMENSEIGMHIGRFYFADLSGKIFSQNADGVIFGFKNNWLKFSAYGAYTGLLNALNTEIITTSPQDFLYKVGNENKEILGIENTLHSFNADYDKIYDFAEKYVVADFALSFPYLFANQTVALEFLAALHIEDFDYNRFYATFLMDGPIWRSLFYKIYSTFGFVDYDSKMKTTNLSEIKFEYFLKKASFGINALYASGEQGKLSSFVGFTKNTSTYSLQEFLYSGILKAGMNIAFRPLECLLLTADSDVIFNASAGDKHEDVEYYGFQYSVGALWQVKSDFQLGLAACQFIDKDNSDNVKKNYFDIKAVLAF